MENVEFEILHTPGHSPGSVSFGFEGSVLMTGDTLFHESVGRVEIGVEAGLEDTDVGANAARLFNSLERLRDYASDPIVLPTHHPGSPQSPVSVRLRDLEARNDGLGRDHEVFVEDLSSDLPDNPPNFERIPRVNVGVETVPDGKVADLEQGPNNCAVE